ncbi:MAG: hypothetical protein Q8O00_03805, partial [Holophaga sp.]|nr:hypothetical protein [Holophaga sp.]
EIRRLMDEHGVHQTFELFKADLEKRGGTTELKGRVRTEKIFDKLLAGASVKEELLEKEAFQALMELERKRETGAPVARFDAGGMEGGELEDQEGGDPDAVKAAEVTDAVVAEETAAPESTEEVAPKPKKSAKKADDGEKKTKKAEKA